MHTSSHRMSQISRIIIASLAAACLSLGFYVFTLRADLAALRSERATAQGEGHAAPQPGGVARGPLPAPPENAASVDPKATAVAGTEPKHPVGPFAQAFAAPEMRQMLHREALGDARKSFADLLQKWNLPPAEADQFLQFVADRDSADSSDALAMLATGKLDAASIAEQEATQDKTRQAHDARLKALLGDERYAEFAAADARAAQLKAVSDYRDHLEAAGTPLSDDQRSALAQIVTKEKPDDNDWHPEDVEFFTQGMTDAQLLRLRQRLEAAHTRITQQAASFLSPDQIAALQSAFRSELDEQDLGLKMVRTFLQNAAK